jgi:hypothetical protein
MRAEVKKRGEKEFDVVLGNHVIGTAKSDCDARFHMHAINREIDAVTERVNWKAQADGHHEHDHEYEMGTCDLVSKPHRRDHCGDAWRPLLSESEKSQNELEPLP